MDVNLEVVVEFRRWEHNREVVGRGCKGTSSEDRDDLVGSVTGTDMDTVLEVFGGI